MRQANVRVRLSLVNLDLFSHRLYVHVYVCAYLCANDAARILLRPNKRTSKREEKKEKKIAKESSFFLSMSSVARCVTLQYEHPSILLCTSLR